MTPDQQPITRADLAAFAAELTTTLKAEFTASQERLKEELKADQDRLKEELRANQDRLKQELMANQDRLKEELRANQDRAVESMATDFSLLRQEIGHIREELNHRIDTLERTMERSTEALRLVQLNLGNLNKWAETLDKNEAALGQNYFKQQRAIEDLQRRVEALEGRRHQQ